MFLLLQYRYAHAGTFQTFSEKGWGDKSVLCPAFNCGSTYCLINGKASSEMTCLGQPINLKNSTEL